MEIPARRAGHAPTATAVDHLGDLHGGGPALRQLGGGAHPGAEQQAGDKFPSMPAATSEPSTSRFM